MLTALVRTLDTLLIMIYALPSPRQKEMALRSGVPPFVQNIQVRDAPDTGGAQSRNIPLPPLQTGCRPAPIRWETPQSLSLLSVFPPCGRPHARRQGQRVRRFDGAYRCLSATQRRICPGAYLPGVSNRAA